MKKRKILSFITALAIAACCIIVPPKSALDVVSEAVDNSGISIVAEGTADLDALKAGDRFTVKITIPKITVHFLDTVHIKVKWDDADAIELVDGSWYDDDTIVAKFNGARSGAANSYTEVDSKGNKIGYLEMAVYGVGDALITAQTIDISDEIVLEAKMRVRSEAERGEPLKGIPYNFEIIYDDVNFAAGYFNAGNTWIPLWEPGIKTASVHIANTVSGIIRGFDFTQGDLWVYLYNEAGTSIEKTDSGNEIKCKCEPVPGSPNEGRFVLKGMKTTGTYQIKVSAWCAFTNFRSAVGTPLTAGDVVVTNTFTKPNETYTYNISNGTEFDNTKNFTMTSTAKIKGSDKVREDIGTFEIRLFGDMDGSGFVDPTDASLILKYLVGSKKWDDNLPQAAGSADQNYDDKNIRKAAANVLIADKTINAKDATQILRKFIGIASVFDTKTISE